MKVLGIETSCDESAAAIVENGRKIISSVVATQFDFHTPYSGVVPEIASRAHVLLLNRAIDLVLKKASGSRKISPRHLKRYVDAIAVTVGPGLMGALLVGKMT